MSCLWRNDPVANEETKYVLLFPPRRFDVKGCSSVLGQAQHALFMMMFAIRSTRALDERVTGSNTCHFCGHWRIHTTVLCTSQPANSFYGFHDSVFCVVFLQRKWCVVGAIGGATACTIPSFCASYACFWHEPAGFDVTCLLGAMLTGHGISTFSHFESAKDNKEDRL